MNKNDQILSKIISMGDVEVGKSCLIKKHCEGNFISDYITTIGIDYGVKKVKTKDGKIMAVNIFDLSGDDDYKIIRKNYFSDAIGCLLVYDVNIKSTFTNLLKWEQEAEINGLLIKNCIVILVGNKIDIKSRREVSTKEGKDYATKKGFYFFETSAKTGVGVNDVFELVFNEMYVKTIDFKSKYLY